VIRNHWRSPRFWLWWWRNRISHELKLLGALLVVAGLGLAGFLAAAGLGGPTTEADVLLLETLTVERVVTLTEGGERTVVRPLRVVRRVTAPAKVLGTAVELLTITTPGRTERQVVPVVRRELVTVAGQPRTIVETRSGRTRTSVVTSDRVVIRERTVTSERVSTAEQTVVQPVTTTRVVRETVPVTQTVRSTDTVRLTETVSETVTVELPSVTVTVTVPPGED
jgi:hypothetical protein